MKTNKEILKIMLIYIDNIRENQSGLCHLVHIIWLRGFITNKEQEQIREYIKANMPLNAYVRRIFCREGMNEFFWAPGKVKPRRTWIEKHIKKLSK